MIGKRFVNSYTGKAGEVFADFPDRKMVKILYDGETQVTVAGYGHLSPESELLDGNYSTVEAVLEMKEEQAILYPDTYGSVPVAHNTSARHNSGKTQLREVDPNFILGIGKVLTKSREKYDEFNWQLPTKLSTPYDSLMRHILAFQAGEDLDKETGEHHLLHAATNLMFMLYHATNNPEYADDRGFKKKVK